MNFQELIKKEDDIYQPSVINKLLSLYGISLKKRFGQNFLINKSVANSIVDLLSLNHCDKVVEIGPGLGAITFLISSKAEKVIAFEIDRGIFNILKDILTFFKVKNVILINEDFLRLSKKSKNLIFNFNKMVSNFPYSSGQRMIIKTIEDFTKIRHVVGTLQKEVADRFISIPGSKNYGLISTWIQYLSEVKVDKVLPSGNFFPSPEIESSIVHFIPKVNDNLNLEQIKSFIKCCFSSRRKILINNIISCQPFLEKNQNFDKGSILKIIKALFGDENIRAEQLFYNDFLRLFSLLKEKYN